MIKSRNAPCPCGSGQRFKKCCGRFSENAAFHVAPPIPYEDLLPIDCCWEQGGASQFDRTVFSLLRDGSLLDAETLLRTCLRRERSNASALNFLGWIAAAVNLPDFAFRYFSEAAKWAPDWQLPRLNLQKVRTLLNEEREKQALNAVNSKHADQPEKFLLIKAWGYGFWSDVSHVLGQLLVAELTGRTPIAHWGSNSRFGDGSDANAFELYFDPLSNRNVAELQEKDCEIWPPKWSVGDLTVGEVNKLKGPFSRVEGLYLLGRQEQIVVSDYYTAVINLMPWIPPSHRLFGQSVDEIYFYLVGRYLRPRKEIMEAVDAFYGARLAQKDFIAVHVRGSDKAAEMGDLDEVNNQYRQKIDEYLAAYDLQRIFLMTDDARVLKYFVDLYGDKIVCTDCQRTASNRGIHYEAVPDRRRLGVEVMVDTYLAVRAKVFVGNGSSNPSQIVRYLKRWPENDVHLLGENLYHEPL